jgi:hypothetical protein
VAPPPPIRCCPSPGPPRGLLPFLVLVLVTGFGLLLTKLPPAANDGSLLRSAGVSPRRPELFTTTGWTVHQLRHTRIRELKEVSQRRNGVTGGVTADGP